MRAADCRVPSPSAEVRGRGGPVTATHGRTRSEIIEGSEPARPCAPPGARRRPRHGPRRLQDRLLQALRVRTAGDGHGVPPGVLRARARGGRGRRRRGLRPHRRARPRALRLRPRERARAPRRALGRGRADFYRSWSRGPFAPPPRTSRARATAFRRHHSANAPLAARTAPGGAARRRAAHRGPRGGRTRAARARPGDAPRAPPGARHAPRPGRDREGLRARRGARGARAPRHRARARRRRRRRQSRRPGPDAR